MKPKGLIATHTEFGSLLETGEDQAIIRYLLLLLVPGDVKAKILSEYNAHVVGINDLRIQSLRQEWEKVMQLPPVDKNDLEVMPESPDKALSWAMAQEYINQRKVVQPDKHYGFHVPDVPALDPFLLNEEPKPDSEKLKTCTFDKCVKKAVFNGYCEEHKHRYYFTEDDE
jgi:hypothetical protein